MNTWKACIPIHQISANYYKQPIPDTILTISLSPSILLTDPTHHPSHKSFNSLLYFNKQSSTHTLSNAQQKSEAKLLEYTIHTPLYPQRSPVSSLLRPPPYSPNNNNRNSHWYPWIHPSRTCFLHSSSPRTPSHSSMECSHASSYPSLAAAQTSQTAPLAANCSANNRLHAKFHFIPHSHQNILLLVFFRKRVAKLTHPHHPLQEAVGHAPYSWDE